MARTRALIDWESQTLRSLLFAPGNHARRLEKVGQFGSDAIVLDLEDAVANAEKIAVRVNGVQTELLEGDLDAVVCDELDCVMVPKVERAETLAAVDEQLGRLERE